MSESTVIKQAIEDWHLESIEFRLNKYGDKKGMYDGRIYLMNGESESFSFKIKPDMAQPFIELISNKIIEAQASLAKNLKTSLGTLNQPKESQNDE